MSGHRSQADLCHNACNKGKTQFPLLTSSPSLQLHSGIAPVAALVNTVAGEETHIVGGCVYALADRANITSLRDLVDMKVVTVNRAQHQASHSDLARLPSAMPQLCVVQVLLLFDVLKIAIFCLQISMGPFSDLSAFEIQSIAQVQTGVSIFGQALQVCTLPCVIMHLQRILHKFDRVMTYKTHQPAHMHGSYCSCCEGCSRQSRCNSTSLLTYSCMQQYTQGSAIVLLSWTPCCRSFAACMHACMTVWTNTNVNKPVGMRQSLIAVCSCNSARTAR